MLKSLEQCLTHSKSSKGCLLLLWGLPAKIYNSHISDGAFFLKPPKQVKGKHP